MNRILWADDEMEHLQPHVLFLKEKGYDVLTVKSGDEAIELMEREAVDVVLLDENMPGLTGLDTLLQIKKSRPAVPVVMITKSEEERIMDDALGSQIADYLIKPVNPKQILLCLKKILEQPRLVTEKTSTEYRKAFNELGRKIADARNFIEWAELYKEITHWEMELGKTDEASMGEILSMQKKDANQDFVKFIERKYALWLSGKEEKPVMSHTVLKEWLFPLLKKNESILLVVIDNLRYDQWKAIQPVLEKNFRVVNERIFCSILPTATAYARNALFSGLLPSEMEKRYPQWWVPEESEEGKNQFEKEFFESHLQRHGIKIPFTYHKIHSHSFATKVLDEADQHFKAPLNIVVYNFVDMLSHTRNELEVIKELAQDEPAYRNLTAGWFRHSPLSEIIKKSVRHNKKVILCTDHGTVRVQYPVKVVGDKMVNTNLRYKTGKALGYNPKEVVEVKKPEDIFLPSQFLSSRFIFAKGYDYFVYQNNYHHYVQVYANTFQHGGISMEEMLIPYVELEPLR
ncbi:MAG: PglZ domain-containing protein [Bacteroidia bacterium]|nr:PglZ domain-containing protein [Bacteroidia bacterium]